MLEIGRPRFAIPRNREGQLHVGASAEIGQLLLIGLGQRRFARIASLLLANDRIRRPDDFRSRHIAFEDEPAKNAAKFRVAFLVAAEVGRKVIERAHRAANIRKRETGEQFAVRHRARAETSPGP